MSRTRGEGRAPAEKQSTVLRTPEERRAHRERLLAEEREWSARNGPVVVKRPFKTVYVDGACTLTARHPDGSHTGPGGWAWVVMHDNGTVARHGAGSEPNTTNQRMELAAALAALRAFRQISELEIVSDSAYLVNCMLQRWYVKWRDRGWTTSAGKPVQSRDLWEAILSEDERREQPATWRHVRGHAGDPGNEAADLLAVEAKRRLMS